MTGLLLLELIEGILILFIIGIAILMAVRIFLKYITLKNVIYLKFSLTMFFLSTLFWSTSLIFISLLLNIKIANIIIMAVYGIFLPIFLLSWMLSFLELYPIKYNRSIMLLLIVSGIIYDVFYTLFLFLYPSLIGVRIQNSIIPGFYSQIYQFLVILIALITAIIFVVKTKKDPDPQVRLKAKLIFVGLILFITSGILENFIEPILFIISFITIIGYFCGIILLYMGFLLPKFILKRIS